MPPEHTSHPKPSWRPVLPLRPTGNRFWCHPLLKALVESTGEFEFDAGRGVELKGLAGTHKLFEISPASN